ncbi:MAG: TPM domain-containing protein [Polymorphobacter sp.]
MLFSSVDKDRVSAAIAAAESRTAGEIVVIISAEPQRYPTTALSVAALLALSAPLLAVLAGWAPADLFPDWDAVDPAIGVVRGFEAFVAVQALLFTGVLALLYYTSLGRRLTPSGLRRDRVHRAALTQFKARGLQATEGRTGVLIYVDEPEHIAEVIADTAVFAKVAPDHWGETIAALTSGIKAGRPADGMVAAIGLAGDVLAAHFPPVADDVNELPDHLIEI